MVLPPDNPACVRGFAFSAMNAQGQYPSVVARLDVVGVEGVTHEQLPGKHSAGALGDLQVGIVAVGRGALGLDGEHVAFDVNVDRGGVHAGQIEVRINMAGNAATAHRLTLA